MPNVPVITPAEAREWEARAVAGGRSPHVLMEIAGRALGAITLEENTEGAGRGVLVACGPGNNGGDGWVAARMIHRLGFAVWVTEAGEPKCEPAATMKRQAIEDGVRLVDADGPWPNVGIVVDAILGSGASGPLRGPVAALVERIRSLEVDVVSADGPTGLDLATGVWYGGLRATTTVAFGGIHRGLLLGRDEIGDLHVADIGLPEADPAISRLLTEEWADSRMKRFSAKAHKGTRGRVVIVGGQPEMVGAVRMAARAAFGAGAGLVHVICPEESAHVMRTAEPDVQVLADDLFWPMRPESIAAVERADVLVVGPGLGRAAGNEHLVLGLLDHARAAVVDADALIALRDVRSALADRAITRPIVVTPHFGEFKVLFPDCAADLEIDPWTAATAAAEASGTTVVLKGVPTVVARKGSAPFTVAAGTPSLATGGSGDILSGLIGTFLAQHHLPEEAAGLGALALGHAADWGGGISIVRILRPMDIIIALGGVWERWAGDPTYPLRYGTSLYHLPRPLEN